MKLNYLKNKGSYRIASILPSLDSKMLNSFGFFKGSSFYFSGIVVGEYRVLVLEDRLLALPESVCSKVMV